MPAPHAVFEPAKYSLPELRFMLEWVGKPPHAALHKGVPKGANPTAIRECLGRIYELVELKTHQGVAWAGEEAVKDSIVRYLGWQEKTLEIQRRGGPRHASQYVWDGKNRPFKYGPGADGAQMVRSEILSTGEYRSFDVNLLTPYGQAGPNIADVAPWLKQVSFSEAEEPDVIRDEEKGPELAYLICGVCEKAFEYQPGKHTSKVRARAAVALHLRTVKSKVDRHLLLLRKEFT